MAVINVNGHIIEVFNGETVIAKGTHVRTFRKDRRPNDFILGQRYDSYYADKPLGSLMFDMVNDGMSEDIKKEMDKL